VLRASSDPTSAGAAIAVAVTFVWQGMMLAISFLRSAAEVPGAQREAADRARHRAPRFRALNTVEAGFALVLLAVISVAGVAGRTPPAIVAAFSFVFAVLAIQLIVVRPRLTPMPRSR
jgi:hypothetical protein